MIEQLKQQLLIVVVQALIVVVPAAAGFAVWWFRSKMLHGQAMKAIQQNTNLTAAATAVSVKNAEKLGVDLKTIDAATASVLDAKTNPAGGAE